jgi:hypothetical protein
MPTYHYIKSKSSTAAEPIISTRAWAQIPLANHSLEVHHQTLLAAAGCRFSDENPSVKIHSQAWLDSKEVIQFFEDSTRW